MKIGSVALAGAMAVSGLAACGGSSTPSASGAPSSGGTGNCASGSINGAGSSFQDPMQQKWIADFTQQCSGAKVNYTSVGSGAGIQQFGAGTVTFAGSDVTMKPDEQSTANQRCGGSDAIHLPVSAGGVAITWNLSSVKTLKLSPDTLAGIFQGTIKKWDNDAIKADNPGQSFPSTPITVFHRSDASGTNAVFSAYMAGASTKWTLGTGKTLNWPTGQGAKGNQGVSSGVSQTSGGITYTEQGFAQQHNLPMAQIKNAGGSYVTLTADNVSKALESATVKPNSANDLSMEINFKPTDPNAYPISTVTYVIVCGKYPSSETGKVSLLKDYLTYAVTTGQSAANSLGFAPLPSAVADKVKNSIDSIS